MTFLRTILCGAALSAAMTTNALAQTHRGELDTDGRLSPGEIRNPHINYKNEPHHRPYYYGWGNRSESHDDGHDVHHQDYEEYHCSDHYARDSGFTRVLWDGIRSGRISERELDELRKAEEDLRRREMEYRRNGMSSWKWRDLQDREAALRDKLNHELNDGELRW